MTSFSPVEADIRYLVDKYSLNGPSYYSYPTVVGFVDSDNSNAEFISDVNKSNSDSLSLYVNIPYCQQLCYYCGCSREITKDRAKGRKIAELLKEEMSLKAPFFNGRTIRSLHIGGGSPNFLVGEDFTYLMEALRSLFRFDDQASLSIELDPRTTLKEQVVLYGSLGFSRVSFGVQDFNDDVQKAINRVQSKESVYNLVELAHQSGFQSINIDLVYGLPLQSRETFKQTLEEAVRLGTSRVVVTKYSHLPSAFPNQRMLEKFRMPDSLSKTHMLIDAISILERAGYKYIGVDHFALPGDPLTVACDKRELLRNFLGYDVRHSEDILGIGPYSISEINGNFYQNAKSIAGYSREIKNGGMAISRSMQRTASDRSRWGVIHSLLCYGEAVFESLGLDLHAFQRVFRDEMVMLKEFESDGLISIDRRGFYLSNLGRLFVRNICMAFDSCFSSRVYRERFPKTV